VCICSNGLRTLSLRSSTILFKGLRLLPSAAPPELLGFREWVAKEDRLGGGEVGGTPSFDISVPGRPAATAEAAMEIEIG